MIYQIILKYTELTNNWMFSLFPFWVKVKHVVHMVVYIFQMLPMNHKTEITKPIIFNKSRQN